MHRTAFGIYLSESAAKREQHRTPFDHGEDLLLDVVSGCSVAFPIRVWDRTMDTGRPGPHQDKVFGGFHESMPPIETVRARVDWTSAACIQKLLRNPGQSMQMRCKRTFRECWPHRWLTNALLAALEDFSGLIAKPD